MRAILRILIFAAASVVGSAAASAKGLAKGSAAGCGSPAAVEYFSTLITTVVTPQMQDIYGKMHAEDDRIYGKMHAEDDRLAHAVSEMQRHLGLLNGHLVAVNEKVLRLEEENRGLKDKLLLLLDRGAGLAARHERAPARRVEGGGSTPAPTSVESDAARVIAGASVWLQPVLLSQHSHVLCDRCFFFSFFSS